MPLWTELANRFRRLVGRSHFDEELGQEIQFHIETRAGELEASGISPALALTQAKREFGSTARIGEEAREIWQFGWLEDLCADLRYAARAFGRRPSFAVTAICCLALGVGANTTMFSVMMEVLFSEPSCRDPRSLVQLRIGGRSFCLAPQYRFLRDAHVFEGVAGMNIGTVVAWREANQTSKLAGTYVTGNFFELVGVPVAMGRFPQAGESGVAVVSYGFWKRRLAGDPNVVGRKLALDGKPFTVIGVLPRDHRNLVGFGFTPDLYLPVDDADYQLYARLQGGMGRKAALARLEALCRELDRVYPEPHRTWAKDIGIFAVGGMERVQSSGLGIGARLTPLVVFFGMLLAVTGLVLLIACANVSSLLLARALSRSRELAIRMSLGCSRGRMVRQLLAESLLLAAGGALAGLLLNVCLTRLLSAVPLPLPWIEFQIRPDWRLLAYSAGIAVVTTLAAGLAPAIQGTRVSVSGPRSLSVASRNDFAGSRLLTLRNVLVIGQLAVSIVLMRGGLLFARNLIQATSLNLGFDTAHTVWATFSTSRASSTPEGFRTLTVRALARLRSLAGVKMVSVARVAPATMPFTRTGEIRPDVTVHSTRIEYYFNAVGPEYFDVMQIPILQGRAFLESDRAGAPAVVVLNENLARLLFGHANPVGHTIRLPENQDARVVGVVRNSRYSLVGGESQPAMYRPYAQSNDGARVVNYMIRAKGAPESLVRDVNAALGDLDASAIVEVRPQRDAFRYLLLQSRTAAIVLGSMALVGIVLASVGLYGVLLHSVTRRTREIGLRIAVGATPAGVLRMVAAESAGLVGTGLAIGLGLSVIALRPLSMFLSPGVAVNDAATFAAASLVLIVVGLTACYAPARRATRIDPMEALRYE